MIARTQVNPAWVAVVILLLGLNMAPFAQAQWSQPAGDAFRSSAASIDGALFDLREGIQGPGKNYSMSPNGVTGFINVGLVDMGRQGVHGIVVDDAGGCHLWSLERGDLNTTALTRIPECALGVTSVAVPTLGLLLVCGVAGPDEPILFAMNVTSREVEWSASTTDLGAVPMDVGSWYCDQSTYVRETDRLFVPFGSFGGTTAVAPSTGRPVGNLVVAIAGTTGEPIWATPIPDAAFLRPASGTDLVDMLIQTGDPNHFMPSVVTATTEGIVVSGAFWCPETCVALGSDFEFRERGFAWIAANGNVVGGLRAIEGQGSPEELQTQGDRNPAGSSWASAMGPQAVFAAGHQLYKIHTLEPGVQQTQRIVTTEPAPPTPRHGPTVWSREDVFVGLSHTVTAYSALDFQQKWSWTLGMDWWVQDQVITEQGELIVLVSRTGDDGRHEAKLLRLNREDGREIQRVPLAEIGEVPGIFQFDRASLVPLPPDRVVIVDKLGSIQVVARTPDHANVFRLDNEYPAPGEEVVVYPSEEVPDYRELIVNWGDSTVLRYMADEPAVHTYLAPGLYAVTATAILDNGTTLSNQVTARVGQEPPPEPPELNILQKMFARENQDMTFGLLGVLVALSGGVIGVTHRHRKQNRLKDALESVERAYAETRDEPVRCEAQLTERRAHAQGLLMDGELTETQFQVVEDRIEQLRRELRESTVEDQFDFLPMNLVKGVHEMLQDGRVTKLEKQAFLDALDADESVHPDQKTVVRQRILEWHARDTGGEVE